jgi:hypothetical protein
VDVAGRRRVRHEEARSRRTGGNRGLSRRSNAPRAARASEARPSTHTATRPVISRDDATRGWISPSTPAGAPPIITVDDRPGWKGPSGGSPSDHASIPSASIHVSRMPLASSTSSSRRSAHHPSTTGRRSRTPPCHLDEGVRHAEGRADLEQTNGLDPPGLVQGRRVEEAGRETRCGGSPPPPAVGSSRRPRHGRRTARGPRPTRTGRADLVQAGADSTSFTRPANAYVSGRAPACGARGSVVPTWS